MDNIEKQALTPDTQLTFTYFLTKHFFGGWLLYYRLEGVWCRCEITWIIFYGSEQINEENKSMNGKRN